MAFSSSDLGLLEKFSEINPLSILAFGLLPIDNVDAGLFSRITMTSMTGAWYLPLSHFEALLVGLAILQVFVMRYFLILPLDVTKLIEDGTLLATSVSRKRRSTKTNLNYEEILEQQRLAETMFTIIRRLDQKDCTLRTLCELEFGLQKGQIYSSGITDLLLNLKKLGHMRIHQEQMIVPNNVTIPDRKVLSLFEEAVLLGAGDNSVDCDTGEVTTETCSSNYPLCTVDTQDLLRSVEEISSCISKLQVST